MNDNKNERLNEDIVNDDITIEPEENENYRTEPYAYKKGYIYQAALRFKKRYPLTIAWRLKKNAAIAEKYLDPGEEVKYVFVGQNSTEWHEIFYTNVIVLTNKRLILAKKRVLFGYSCTTVTPELYNDLKVKKHLIFGDVVIDTLHELITISHVSPEALDEIETNINTFMLKAKRKFYMAGRK